MLSPDYTFYSEVWGGKLGKDEFDAGVSRATSFVEYLVGYNEVDTEDKAIAFKKAACAALEAFETYGYEDGGSFRIGDFTAPSGAKTGKQIAAEDARQQLFMSGLLWGGLA